MNFRLAIFLLGSIPAMLFFSSSLFAQQPAPATGIQPDPSYHILRGKSFVQAKNYYLLTLLEALPDVKELLRKDAVLQQLAGAKKLVMKTALENCGRDAASCFAEAARFNDSAIRQVSARLAALYQPQNALGKLVRNHLVPSGTYYLFRQLPASEMLVKAWEQDAAGVNFAIGVYAEGKKPHYPNIDSLGFDTRNGRMTGLLYNTVSLLLKEQEKENSFFSLSLDAALHFIEWDEREQAADDEPMAETVNKPTVHKIKTTSWNQYPYSVILVPGAGPDQPNVALSAEGMIRCRLAAIQYRNGLAPFILVSGGKVHPYKTKYCEATEMKKYLVEKLNIPESAIIVDPHARHTTTNMRNGVRLMFRYGMPMQKPGITCTTRGQSLMIGTTLIDRCMRELHAVPYRNGKRLTETEIEFYPLLEALHINPEEPIDP